MKQVNDVNYVYVKRLVQSATERCVVQITGAEAAKLRDPWQPNTTVRCDVGDCALAHQRTKKN